MTSKLKTMSKNDSFYFACKENFFLNIHPMDPASVNRDEYCRVVTIANAFIEQGLYDMIADYLECERYFLNLWAARVLLLQSNINTALREKCLSIIASPDNV